MTDDEMRDRVVAAAVADSQRLQPGGCCAAPEWCGVLCSYHSGYRDGAEAILHAIEQLPP
ncbi:MAG TPA: hypothetical protein VFK70_16340 [Vicinamibacteria bacterium]|nr:hypothetical protein [Vicinamibacteria bacterium]